VHRGSAGAEHPEGGLLDGLCLNKQAPRQTKKRPCFEKKCLLFLNFSSLLRNAKNAIKKIKGKKQQNKHK
jgi:hypothetical protein